MEVVFFGLIGLGFVVLGPIAFFLALGARSRLELAERKITALEARLGDVEAGRTQINPSAVPKATPQDETLAAPEPEPAPPAADWWSRQAASETPDVPKTEITSEPSQEPKTATTPLPGAIPAETPTVVEEAITLPGGSLPPVEPPVDEAPATPSARTPSASLEERLGTRWAVWVGGAALAIGALLLVRQAILQGFFGPGVRILMGLVFSAALAGAGEWLRRKERNSGDIAEATDTFSFARPSIPAILTATGAMGAFGSVYAAHALYGFIGPALAFVALGAIGIATIFAAALHGSMLAGVGLLGAMASPLLVASQTPSAWPVVIYLGVVAFASYALARVRKWLWLAAATAIGSALWTLALLLPQPEMFAIEFYRAALAHLLIQTALAVFFVCCEPWFGTRDEDAVLDPLSSACMVVSGLLALFVFVVGLPIRFGELWFVAAAVMSVILAVGGLMSAPALAGAAIAGVVIIGVMILWPAPDRAWPPRAILDVLDLPMFAPQWPAAFCAFALVLSLALSIACAWRLWRGAALQQPPALILSGAGVVTPLLALVIAYLRFTASSASMTFALLACALALVFAVIAQFFRSRLQDGEPPTWKLALGSYASGAIATSALALVFAMEGGSLTVALALAAAGAAFVSVRLDIPALRWCVLALGLAVAARYLWDPRIGVLPGSTPVFNWLLFGYGVPAACFAYAAWAMKKARGDDNPVRISVLLTVMCSALLIFFEVRHVMNDGDIFARTSGHIELGLHALTSICFSVVLMQFGRGGGHQLYRMASYLFNLVSAAVVVFGLALRWNPFLPFTHEMISGGTFVNSLLLAYAMPAIAYALAVWWMVRNDLMDFRRHVAVGLAILLSAIYVFGELQYVLTSGDLRNHDFPLTELGIYTAALAIFALALKLLEQRRISPLFERASRLFGTAAAVLTIFGPGVYRNPLLPGVGGHVEGGLLFNNLLAGMLLPALAFAFAAYSLKRSEAVALTYRFAAGLGAFCFVLYVHNQLHHLWINPNWGLQSYSTGETGLHAIIELLFAFVIVQFAMQRDVAMASKGVYATGMIAAAISIAGSGMLANPLFAVRVNPVEGGLLFNGLLLAYVLPGLLVLLIARHADSLLARWFAIAMRMLGVALIFGYLTLQVRRFYQGADIHMSHLTSDGEWYTYSLVWLAYGVALLAYGLWRQTVEVRLASAVFIVLSVVKVFLFDLNGLEGVLRALSFIGLGLVLIGIGLVYQKFVFVRKVGNTPAPPEAQ